MSEACYTRKRLRRAFERAANHYDEIAQVPQEIARRMLQRLDLLRVSVNTLVDAGAGTAWATPQLLRRFEKASLLSLDLSDSMLRVRPARGGLIRWLGRVSRRSAVCADIQSMPLVTSSVEFIWSNLALHWVPDLRTAFAEMFRVLRPGGLLMFSMCGPDTLQELRASRETDEFRLNDLADMHDIGDMLVDCEFSDPVMDMERLTLTYASVPALLRDLQAHGSLALAGPMRRGLVGKARLSDLTMRYEVFRQEDGRIPATVEVIYGHAWKLHRGATLGERPVIPIRPA